MRLPNEFYVVNGNGHKYWHNGETNGRSNGCMGYFSSVVDMPDLRWFASYEEAEKELTRYQKSLEKFEGIRFFSIQHVKMTLTRIFD